MHRVLCHSASSCALSVLLHAHGFSKRTSCASTASSLKYARPRVHSLTASPAPYLHLGRCFVISPGALADSSTVPCHVKLLYCACMVALHPCYLMLYCCCCYCYGRSLVSHARLKSHDRWLVSEWSDLQTVRLFHSYCQKGVLLFAVKCIWLSHICISRVAALPCLYSYS